MSLKILLTGTTTSGKTTLIEGLKAKNLPGIVFIEEEARKFLEQNPGLEKDPQLQDMLFTKQVTVEQEAVKRRPKIIVCDRGIPDNIAHALLFGQAVKEEWKEWARTYDEIFLFNSADINYQQPTELQQKIDSGRDWIKYRQDLDRCILLALQECGLNYKLLNGNVEERLSTIEGVFKTYITSIEGSYRLPRERK